LTRLLISGEWRLSCWTPTSGITICIGRPDRSANDRPIPLLSPQRQWSRHALIAEAVAFEPNHMQQIQNERTAEQDSQRAGERPLHDRLVGAALVELGLRGCHEIGRDLVGRCPRISLGQRLGTLP